MIIKIFESILFKRHLPNQLLTLKFKVKICSQNTLISQTMVRPYVQYSKVLGVKSMLSIAYGSHVLSYT